MRTKGCLIPLSLILLGGLGLIRLVKLKQEYSIQQQVVAELQQLVDKASNAKNTPDIVSLRSSHKKLKETISILESIPNLPGFSYLQAQDGLAKIRLLFYQNEERLKTEENALTDLELAHSLNTDATKLIQKEPYSLENWQLAKNKWQQAINLLNNMSVNTLVSTQVKDDLKTYRLSYAAVTERLKKEETAFGYLQSATEVAQEASSITNNSSYELKYLLKNQSQWQLVLSLLNNVPSTTALVTEAEKQKIYYRNNLQNVTEALNQMKRCLAQSDSSELSCGEVNISIVMPPINSALNSSASSSTSHNTTYSDNNADIPSRTPPNANISPSQRSPEELLAGIDANEAHIDKYAFLLDQVEERCNESRSKIAAMNYKAVELSRQRGTPTNNFEMLINLRDSTSSVKIRMSCAEIYALITTLR